MYLKLSELMKAVNAMGAIVELPVGEPPNTDQWQRLMHSWSWLKAEIECSEFHAEVVNDPIRMV